MLRGRFTLGVRMVDFVEQRVVCGQFSIGQGLSLSREESFIFDLVSESLFMRGRDGMDFLWFGWSFVFDMLGLGRGSSVVFE